MSVKLAVSVFTRISFETETSIFTMEIPEVCQESKEAVAEFISSQKGEIAVKCQKKPESEYSITKSLTKEEIMQFLANVS